VHLQTEQESIFKEIGEIWTVGVVNLVVSVCVLRAKKSAPSQRRSWLHLWAEVQNKTKMCTATYATRLTMTITTMTTAIMPATAARLAITMITAGKINTPSPTVIQSITVQQRSHLVLSSSSIYSSHRDHGRIQLRAGANRCPLPQTQRRLVYNGAP